MNKKKSSQVNIPKSYQEDNVKENINLIESINNNNSEHNSIKEPSSIQCVDIDFDETDESNVIESTQVGSHSMSESHATYTSFEHYKNNV